MEAKHFNTNANEGADETGMREGGGALPRDTVHT